MLEQRPPLLDHLQRHAEIFRGRFCHILVRLGILHLELAERLHGLGVWLRGPPPRHVGGARRDLARAARLAATPRTLPCTVLAGGTKYFRHNKYFSSDSPDGGSPRKLAGGEGRLPPSETRGTRLLGAFAPGHTLV